MKKFALVAVLAALNGLYLHAQEAPKAPAPQKEHEWLKQLAGEWVTDAEAVMVPGQPPVKCKGSEKTRTLGGFWAVSETKSEFMGTPEVGQMTLGYDAQKKKFVGTWVCSMADYLWKYEGSLDSTGKILTLETEGPDMMAPGKMTKMKDVIEVKSPTHKTLTSYILGPDGKWVQFMTMNAHRKN